MVLVTKHHDGVLLWPSATPNPHKPRWGSERDLVGDLAAAVRGRDLRFGTYYSGGLDWTFGGLPMRDFQAMLGAIPQTPEYLAYADAHWDELIDRYRPDVLWNDIGYPAAADLPALFERYYARRARRRGEQPLRLDRPDRRRSALRLRHARVLHQGRARPGSGRALAASARASATTARRTSRRYLSPDALVRMFVDIVAHGGNLLLNVGPNADGTIPWVQAQRLLALGWWLRTNGDAIYGTRPWTRTDGTWRRRWCGATSRARAGAAPARTGWCRRRWDRR